LDGIGERQNLQIIGEFPDGTVRIISAELYGTTYASRDIAVAMVDPNGVVTAMNLGETVIVVRNGESETQARIVVRAKPTDGTKQQT
jgi:hypothetical protein